MMAISHAIVGTAIAASVPNPWIAGGLILTSHFLMDLIPHWDFGTDFENRSAKKTGILAILDTWAGFFLAFLLFGSTLPPLTIFLATSLANFPDWLTAIWFIFFEKKETPARVSIIRKLFYWIYVYPEKYFHTRTTFWHGMMTMTLTVGFFLILLGNLQIN